MMKTKQDNNETDGTSVVYAENETKLSWSIGPCTIYDKNQTGQRRDWSYRFGLLQNRN